MEIINNFVSYYDNMFSITLENFFSSLNLYYMDWTREDLENKSKRELIEIIMNFQEDLENYPDLYDDYYNNEF